MQLAPPGIARRVAGPLALATLASSAVVLGAGPAGAAVTTRHVGHHALTRQTFSRFAGTPSAAVAPHTTASAAGGTTATTATLTANQPPLAVTNGTPGPISPIVLAGDSAAGPLVFTLTGHAGFDITHPVTVTVTAGDATVSADQAGTFAASATVTPTATTVTVYVTAGTQPSTFQLSDIQVTSDGPGLASVTANDGSATYGAVTATASVATQRLSGSDRYATAAAVFTDAFSCQVTANRGTNGDGTSTVVIARADDFPDALAGSYAAGQLGTGVLLTESGAVPTSTLSALQSAGVTQVLLIGGTGAISSGVQTKLAGTAAHSCSGTTGKRIAVSRISATDRYATAATVAEDLSAGDLGPSEYVGTAAYDGTTTKRRTAIIATGDNFPDALAAGPMAYWGSNVSAQSNGFGFPLLLTYPTTLSYSAKRALTALGIQQVVIVGGTGAVSSTVQSQLGAMGLRVKRIGGISRTDTARLIAQFETAGASSGLGYDTDQVSLTRGDAFPDALAGGPWAGSVPIPILLSTGPDTLSQPTHSYLAGRTASRIWGITVFGGEGAVWPSTLQAAANSLTGR